MSSESNFAIIAQYDDFIVVEKKASVDFHDDNGVSGLFTQVKQALLKNDTRSSFSDEQIIYPLHRLDKLTTGLILFAKTKQAAADFGQLFEQHQINKYYLAVADSKPKKKQGWVKGDMSKSRRGSYKLLRSMNNPAITQFKSAPLTDGHRLFLLKPHSGKTHQLRVALKSIGAPIVGDPIYHHTSELNQTICSNTRLYLHAWQLAFNYKGQSFKFIADNIVGLWFNTKEALEHRNNWTPVQARF